MFKPLNNFIDEKYSIVGFDTETITNLNNFYMGSFSFNDGSFKVFYNKEDMINFLETKRVFNNTLIVATNLQFDLMTLFYNHPKISFFSMLYKASKLIKAECYVDNNGKITNEKTKNKLIFVDTTNYYPASVKKLGEIIGIPKLSTPKCLGRLPNNEIEKIELEKYNMNDSLISRKFVELIKLSCQKINCRLKTTIAGISMDYFQRHHLKEVWFQPNREDLLLHYPAYYGGRTEVFQRGKINNAYYYDFNSLYPSVMKENFFPHPNSMYKKNFGSLEIINKYEGISKVKVKTPENMNIPILPYRDEKVKFPLGTFEGVYSHAELRYAMANGYKITPSGYTIYYKKTFKPFESFVEKCYNERLLCKKQKDSLELMWKLIMNSLYGKFAQNINEDVQIIHKSKVTIKDLQNPHEIIGDYFRVSKTNPKIPFFVFPIMSIYITSYARIKLHKVLTQRRVNPIYCDTDSIITTHKIKSDPNNLGELKLENEILEGYFIRPKLYCYDYKDEEGKVKTYLKAKGLMQSIVKGEEKKLFLKLMNGETFEFDQFVKFKTALRSKKEYKRGVLLPNQIIKSTKKLNLEDDKRLWGEKLCYTKLQKSKALRYSL